MNICTSKSLCTDFCFAGKLMAEALKGPLDSCWLTSFSPNSTILFSQLRYTLNYSSCQLIKEPAPTHSFNIHSIYPQALPTRLTTQFFALIDFTLMEGSFSWLVTCQACLFMNLITIAHCLTSSSLLFRPDSID